MNCSAKQLIRDAVHKNDFLKQLAKEQVSYSVKHFLLVAWNYNRERHNLFYRIFFKKKLNEYKCIYL